MRKIIAVVRMLTLVVVATSLFCTNISFRNEHFVYHSKQEL
jgi:hypothetical protein